MSCSSTDLEKQIVFRTSRFSRVRKGELFPFKLWRIRFAHGMMIRLEMTIIDICTIGIEMTHAHWGSQRFELSEDCILMCSQHIGSYLAGSMINRLPQPALLGCLFHNTPHFINVRLFNFLNLHEDLIGFHLLDFPLGDGSKLRSFFFMLQ